MGRGRAADRASTEGAALVSGLRRLATRRGDSFQAVRRHAYADPLEAPGEADLTAHVDFEALAVAAAPALATPMATQGELLLRLGIGQRAEALARGLEGERLAAHLAAFDRLTSTEEMGSLFRAMAVHPASAPPPTGFKP
jgi:SAM-dependent MidA family methyltransferase